jgi:REP element-mobilizing transposase RayT
MKKVPTRPTRKHLTRLDRIHDTHRAPVFFITVCVRDREGRLANLDVAEILVGVWQRSEELYGWRVGRYVIMPDHTHFFAAPVTEEAKDLSVFVAAWKRWTSRRIRERYGPTFSWQPEFFDHLLRSEESYAEKWEYVRRNPVRAGLVAEAGDWPYQGSVSDLEW